MSNAATALRHLRKICAELPDTKETITWGKPHFRVGEKIFAGFGDKDGIATIGFKLETGHAAAIIKIPGFTKAPYVGHKGWVSMDTSRITDWAMVRELIQESYELIAPKKSLAKRSTAAAKSDATPMKKKVASKNIKRAAAKKKHK